MAKHNGVQEKDRSTETLPAHQVSGVPADFQQCTQAKKSTNDPDVRQDIGDWCHQIRPECNGTECEGELAEQDSDVGRTANQASITEMRGLENVTQTGFEPNPTRPGLALFMSVTDTRLAAETLCPLRKLKTASEGKLPRLEPGERLR